MSLSDLGCWVRKREKGSCPVASAIAEHNLPKTSYLLGSQVRYASMFIISAQHYQHAIFLGIVLHPMNSKQSACGREAIGACLLA